MQNVPSVGGTRGIFEIFVPGLFLLANILAAAWLLPWEITKTQVSFQPLDGPLTSLVILVCFGYLLGVLLRAARADTPDRWSSWYLRRFHRGAQLKDGSFALFAIDRFPYFDWLEQNCREHLPAPALQYFRAEWAPHRRAWRNKPFFNLCKIAVVNAEKPTSLEVYAAEALTRYLACMFYALRIALVIALLSALAQFPAHKGVGAVWLSLAALYAIALWVIVKSFRFLRFKEVDTLFCACFVSKIRLMGDMTGSNLNMAPEVDRGIEGNL